jgi:hypothetical protein
VTSLHCSIDLDMRYGRQRISYFDRLGHDVPVLFVHGLGNAASNFEELLPQQVLMSHRLIALDLPGCGRSPYSSKKSLDIDNVVTLVEKFVDQLDLQKYLLVGASMGGLIALLSLNITQSVLWVFSMPKEIWLQKTVCSRDLLYRILSSTSAVLYFRR